MKTQYRIYSGKYKTAAPSRMNKSIEKICPTLSSFSKQIMQYIWINRKE